MDYKDVSKYSKDLSVLYVEDEVDLLEETAEFLEDFFYRVDTAKNGLIAFNKFNEYYDGSVIEFRQPIAPERFINRKGDEEKIVLSLNFRTSYNGMLANQVKMLATFVICENGLTATKVGAQNIFRNTINANKKSLFYLEQFAKIIESKDNYIEALKELDKRDITNEEVEAFINELIEFDPEAKTSTKKKNIRAKIKDSVIYETDRRGKSLFGFLQGVSYYTNHVVDKDEEYLLFKGGDKMNNKAQELVFAELN